MGAGGVPTSVRLRSLAIMATSDLTWRPLTVDDAAGLARLAAAVEEADGLDDHRVEADMRKQLTDPMRDLDGTMGVFDGDRMVGFLQVWGRVSADPVHQMRSDGMVHPDYRRRGIGGKLLAWGCEAALRIHARQHPGRPLTLHAYANERNEGSTAALAAAGFKPARWFFLMQRNLNGPPIGDVSVPDDLTLTTYRDELSEPVRSALNEGFIPDHWGSSPMTGDMWRHRITGGRQFRPDLTFVLLDKASRQVAAFLISELVPSRTAARPPRSTSA